MPDAGPVDVEVPGIMILRSSRTGSWRRRRLSDLDDVMMSLSGCRTPSTICPSGHVALPGVRRFTVKIL